MASISLEKKLFLTLVLLLGIWVSQSLSRSMYEATMNKKHEMWMLRTELSKLKLVDCDISGEDQGCNGGLMDDAFEFIIQDKGLTTETNYPCQGSDGTCSKNKAASHAAKITGHEDVPANNEPALLNAVTKQSAVLALSQGRPPMAQEKRAQKGPY
ncbi:hypothetical protein Dsin_021000 [Dipteronia sinensis]|uniref:Peptidase C1A papain C-terminal domain-containing protein n=1 Tax=Dipteronia sinensis TaxID=43782 RepID=A0AAE0E5H5_9ROSI|nr:hypothetical protein Dsin_021000 [Dipteronia sinensis]